MSSPLFIPHYYKTEQPNEWMDHAVMRTIAQTNDINRHRAPGARGVIGFHGPKEVGKNSTAELVRLALKEDLVHIQIDYFAKPLYDAVSAMTGIPVYVLQDRRYKEHPINWPGAPRDLAHLTPRRLLQLMGTEMVRTHCGDLFWVNRLMDRSEQFFSSRIGSAVVLASDVRYPSEAEACDVIVELAREGVSYTGEHSSEVRLPQELIDVTVTLVPETNYVKLAFDLAVLLAQKTAYP